MKWWKKDFKPDILESIYFEGIKTYSNLVVPCPYKGIRGVYKFNADILKYPPIVPAGDYRLDSRIYDGGNG